MPTGPAPMFAGGTAHSSEAAIAHVLNAQSKRLADIERQLGKVTHEYGVLRLPDSRISSVHSSLEEADAAIKRSYALKEEQRAEAEKNRVELDAPGVAPTNEPWMNWEKGSFGVPPVKDMEWKVVRRIVSEWEPVDA